MSNAARRNAYAHIQTLVSRRSIARARRRTNGDGGLIIVSHVESIEIFSIFTRVILSAFDG
jgi:hypothetical protein